MTSVIVILLDILSTVVPVVLLSMLDATVGLSGAPGVVVCDVTVASAVLGVTEEMNGLITLVINIVAVIILDESIVTEGMGEPLIPEGDAGGSVVFEREIEKSPPLPLPLGKSLPELIFIPSTDAWPVMRNSSSVERSTIIIAIAAMSPLRKCSAGANICACASLSSSTHTR